MKASQHSVKIINQISHILTQLSDEDYVMARDIFNGTSFGQHFRHILDFYSAVVKSADSDTLDYADRERSKSIESSTELAIESFFQLQHVLDQIKESKQITVFAEYDAFDDERPTVLSTIGRELLYAYDHAIHHLAIIKIGLKADCPSIKFDNNLGVAPSTIRHQSLEHKH